MPGLWSVVGVTVVGGRWAMVLFYAVLNSKRISSTTFFCQIVWQNLSHRNLGFSVTEILKQKSLGIHVTVSTIEVFCDNKSDTTST